jgi:cyanophycinase
MCHAFLIGGGWTEAAFPLTYGRFLSAASGKGELNVAVVLTREHGSEPAEQFQRFAGVLTSAGALQYQLTPMYVSPDQPLTAETLTELRPTGVFVGGGWTPGYYGSLCRDTEWVQVFDEKQLPYCGFSAGAAIAAAQAIVGGWQRLLPGGPIAVTVSDAAEDLEILDVRPGLGLVPFSLDVHATQWGTLPRMIHSIDAGLTAEGWAIDEDTMLEWTPGVARIHGLGNAYHVNSSRGTIEIEIHQAD